MRSCDDFFFEWCSGGPSEVPDFFYRRNGNGILMYQRIYHRKQLNIFTSTSYITYPTLEKRKVMFDSALKGDMFQFVGG